MSELHYFHRTLRAWREGLLPTGTPGHRLYSALLHPLKPSAKAESPSELRSRLRRSGLAFADPAEPELSVLVPMYGQASLTDRPPVIGPPA